MYSFERVNTDSIANAQHAALLSQVFEKPQLFTPKFIEWQYANNPSGSIVGYNAVAGDVIAGHYVTQPFYANLNNEKQKGLLSLNTATHHEHRGKGLFTQLADKTYQAAADEGYKFVIGVANQNSVKGFTTKLGFQLVGQLHAKVGLAAVPEYIDKSVMYERVWDEPMLNWRLANPSAQYFSRGNRKARVFSNTHISYIKAEMISVNADKIKQQLPHGGFRPLTLYIGLDSGINFGGSLFFDIPQRFRPAPLFLIFKDLTGKNLQLDFQNIRFQLIDFDAY